MDGSKSYKFITADWLSLKEDADNLRKESPTQEFPNVNEWWTYQFKTNAEAVKLLDAPVYEDEVIKVVDFNNYVTMKRKAVTDINNAKTKKASAAVHKSPPRDSNSKSSKSVARKKATSIPYKVKHRYPSRALSRRELPLSSRVYNKPNKKPAPNENKKSGALHRKSACTQDKKSTAKPTPREKSDKSTPHEKPPALPIAKPTPHEKSNKSTPHKKPPALPIVPQVTLHKKTPDAGSDSTVTTPVIEDDNSNPVPKEIFVHGDADKKPVSYVKAIMQQVSSFTPENTDWKLVSQVCRGRIHNLCLIFQAGYRRAEVCLGELAKAALDCTKMYIECVSIEHPKMNNGVRSYSALLHYVCDDIRGNHTMEMHKSLRVDSLIHSLWRVVLALSMAWPTISQSMLPSVLCMAMRRSLLAVRRLGYQTCLMEVHFLMDSMDSCTARTRTMKKAPHAVVAAMALSSTVAKRSSLPCLTRTPMKSQSVLKLLERMIVEHEAHQSPIPLGHHSLWSSCATHVSYKTIDTRTVTL